jgi:hypothetical protein
VQGVAQETGRSWTQCMGVAAVRTVLVGRVGGQGNGL